MKGRKKCKRRSDYEVQAGEEVRERTLEGKKGSNPVSWIISSGIGVPDGSSSVYCFDLLCRKGCWDFACVLSTELYDPLLNGDVNVPHTGNSWF